MSKGLFRSGMIVSAMTMISRILGLVRDAVVANLLGAGTAADVFLFANRIPNFLRRLFAEGAFAQAFVPVLSEIKEQQGDDKVRIFVAQAAGTLGTILLLVTLFGVVASPVIAALFGTGWFIDWWQGGPDAEKFELASSLLKLTFPYLFFVSLVALSGAVMNVYNRFAVAAFTPVLLNVSIIGCAILLHDQFSVGAYALAIGVFLGGVVQLLFQLPFLYKAKMLARPRWGWQDENVKKVRKLMLPALFGVSISQINLLLDTVIASLLMTGSIAWLYYSDRLIEFPLGLFGIGIATVILPALSKLHSSKKSSDFQHTLDWGVRFVIFLGLPAMVGLMIISPLIITVLFDHGAFKEAGIDHVKAVSLGVVAYSVGLVSFMLIKVLAPGFYSRQDTKTPVRIGIVTLVLNMVFNIMLAPFIGYLGLALATSMSASCNAYLLYRQLKKENVYQFSSMSGYFTLKCLLASVTMGALVWFTSRHYDWPSWHFSEQVMLLVVLLIIAVVSYFFMLFLMGVRLNTIKSVAITESN
ncbi:Putative lipid II flippase MurJ [Pseudoalteromonas issachenkonii]|nr:MULTISPECIES: murein biosynthesis integral membrane protein MurJ [Pseudoalteromonas]ALQ54278.1 Putative lipid II flippase MurJ [Pseudoalteromonas issachenkonii]MDN3404384.1 murein biosynthesis integral membrane protein MurJ [Pseudoalteromonas sp. APC 3218]MDN3408287.1 murein biosynthesis integral membrane protein MurJ [Pseudoalteromonas sp. APC 3894]MDN3415927.1 murein biosynthesis integral membrane protein MurJ [Pseudoalteromonas sp. APC 3227]MDN3419625.1 murein biosynthesis integral membr